jgi:putative transposase
MPRKPRPEEASAVSHVFARGVRSLPIFADDLDRRRYLRLLSDVIAATGWSCLQYCLMTNHVHLLIETPTPNLAAGMCRLHGDYAVGFNKRHGFAGHVFQGRYGAVRVYDDAQLVSVVRYIDRNPAEAGLPALWPWCSSAALRGAPAPPWLATERLYGLLPEGRIELDEPQGGQAPLMVVEGYPSVRRASARREMPSSISSAVTPE